MARKTFISYKYSEARDLRDRIIDALGDDVRYYKGETSNSPDLTDTKTENIKKHLKDMMFETSVTIVIISPNMTQSEWIDWEVEYSLKEITRDDRTSRSNGVVGVIQKVNGTYGWIVNSVTGTDGCSYKQIDDDKLYDIITKNRFNLESPVYTCQTCKTVNKLSGSYISLINEEDFLSDSNKYIENAFEKSKNIEAYNITKSVRK